MHVARLAAGIASGLAAFLFVPATPGLAAGHPVIPYGATWTVDTAANSLALYAPDASGADAPIASVSGPTTGLDAPSAVAVDAEGRIFATNSGSDSITEYQATAMGDAEPIRTIVGAHTGLDGPSSITIDESRDGRNALPGNRHFEYLYVTNPDSNTVEAFDASDDGDVLPAFSIEGTKTGLNHPIAVTPSAFGEPIVVNRPATGRPSITEYESFGNHKPITTIKPAAPHGFKDPTAVVAGGDETVWVADAGRNSVTKYVTLPFPRSVHLDPIAVIHGAATGTDGPSGLTRTADGHLVVTNSGDHTLRIFPPDGDGNVAPTRTLDLGAGTSGADVYGVAPSAPTALRVNLHGHAAKLRWTAPSETGGGLEGYFAEVFKRSDFGGHGAVKHANYFAPFVTTQRTHDRVTHLKPGKRYVAIAESVNAFGNSASAPPVTFRVPRHH